MDQGRRRPQRRDHLDHQVQRQRGRCGKRRRPGRRPDLGGWHLVDQGRWRRPSRGNRRTDRRLIQWPCRRRQSIQHRHPGSASSTQATTRSPSRSAGIFTVTDADGAEIAQIFSEDAVSRRRHDHARRPRHGRSDRFVHPARHRSGMGAGLARGRLPRPEWPRLRHRHLRRWHHLDPDRPRCCDRWRVLSAKPGDGPRRADPHGVSGRRGGIFGRGFEGGSPSPVLWVATFAQE